MALTLYEAHKLSRNPLTRGALLAIATSDELAAVLPMVPKAGESFSYNREKALPSVGWLAPDHTSMEESTATTDKVLVPLRILGGNADISHFSELQQGEITAQKPFQVGKKLKALGREIGQKAITGSYASSTTINPSITGVASPVAGPLLDTSRHGPASLRFNNGASTLEFRGPGDRTYGPAVDVSANGTYTLEADNPNKTLTVTVTSASLPGSDTEVLVWVTSTSNEPDGLEKLVPSSQIIASTGANGDALTFDVMDQLIDEKVKVRENLYFFGNSKLKRKFLALMRNLGGTAPKDVAIPGINRPVPTYRGIPFLQNDWIASTESKGSGTTLSSLYLGSMSHDEGFYAGVGQAGERALFDGDPRRIPIMGVRIRSLGELEDKEFDRMRVTMYAAFALGSELAVGRASELVTA